MTSPDTNVLLVVLDSVRADRLSCYGYSRRTSPNLDALAAEGVRFTQAYSESTWTLPSLLTLLTGLAPREHRGETTRKLPLDMPTLTAAMSGAGYQTFAGTGNVFLGPRTNTHRFFDTLYTPPQLTRGVRWVWCHKVQPLGLADIGGAALVRRFGRWVRRADRPWWGLLWFNDVHHPYMCPPSGNPEFPPRPLSVARRRQLTEALRSPRQFAAVATAQDLDDVSVLYDAAIAYADALVGRVLNDLAASGLAERTMVIVVADHGDMLGERGLAGHGPAAGMYDPLLHVPLIVRAPGLAPGVSPALVQLADVTHTVAATAGAEGQLAATGAERMSLLDAARGTGRAAAVCERDGLEGRRLAREMAQAPDCDFTPHQAHVAAAIAGGYKLISRDGVPSELYNLASDPAETHDVSAQHPHQVANLQAVIADLHGRSLPHTSTEGLSADDEEILDRRLRDLGYL